MKKSITVAVAAALAFALSAGTASADETEDGGERWTPMQLAPKCATPAELARVDLGDSPREVRRKITAKAERWPHNRHLMQPRVCRYFVTDRSAAALILFKHRRVVAVWAHGGAYDDVPVLT